MSLFECFKTSFNQIFKNYRLKFVFKTLSLYLDVFKMLSVVTAGVAKYLIFWTLGNFGASPLENEKPEIEF